MTNIGAMDGNYNPYIIASAAPPVPDLALNHEYFHTKAIGTSDGTITNLSNPTASPLAIAGIATTGDFAQSNNCGATLAPGTSCTITITFSPTAVGERNGTLTVTDDGPGSPRTALLTGTGTPGSGTPALTPSPATIDFSPINPDNSRQLRVLGALQNNPPQTVKVKNTGTAPATITDFGVGGTDSADFAITANTCANGTLAQNAECTITVQFTPTRGGPTNAAMKKERLASLSFREATQSTATTVTLKGGAGAPPMMYVHGIKTNVDDQGFRPLLDPIQAEFPPGIYPDGFRKFRYYQDKGDPNYIPKTPIPPDSRIALPYPPVGGVPERVTYFGNKCDSQSDFGINIGLLWHQGDV